MRKPDNPARHFAIAFAIAIIIYVLAYGTIEHLRNRKGPWRLTFTHLPLSASSSNSSSLSSSTSNPPMLIIDEPALRLTNVQIVFSGQPAWTNPAIELTFGQPTPVPYDLPFGKCIFMDTTFLPGTLTVQVFGHELELLPRVLIIDHAEHTWQPEEKIILPTASPPRIEP